MLKKISPPIALLCVPSPPHCCTALCAHPRSRPRHWRTNPTSCIDDLSPSKEAIEAAGGNLLALATGLRSAEELYLPDDPGQLRNVAGDSRYAVLKDELSRRLLDELRRSGDPRLVTIPIYSIVIRTPAPNPINGQSGFRAA